MRDRGMWWSVVVTALAVGCLAATYALVVQGQEAAPSARRLAAMKADYKRSPTRPVENQALVDLGRSLFWDQRVSASDQERLDLIAFMETLTGMPEAEAQPKLPEAPR